MPPTATTSDCTVVEDDVECALTFQLTQPLGFAVTVRYWTGSGNDTATDADYVPASGELDWRPTRRLRRSASRVREDAEEEPTESFILGCEAVYFTPNGSAYIVPTGNPTTTAIVGTVTIVDDDEAVPTTPPEARYPFGPVEPMPPFEWLPTPMASRYRLTIYAQDGHTVLFAREYDAETICPNICRVPPKLTFPEARAFQWDVAGGGRTQWGPSTGLNAFEIPDFMHVIMTLTGTGDTEFNGDDRPAFTANVDVNGLVALAINDLLIAEYSGRIRRVSQDGVIRAIAGTGTPPETGCGADGQPAAGLSLPSITALAADAQGNIYFATAGPNGQCAQVRRIDAATGLLSTVAGQASGFGYWGDGGPATEAALSSVVSDLAVDHLGNIYVSDTGNRRVRRIDGLTGVITTLAGDGADEDRGDGGPATAAGLRTPRGVAVDAAGNVYVADEGAHRVRRIDVASSIVTTVAATADRATGRPTTTRSRCPS